MSMLISIDNGGTLTDACVIHGNEIYRAKALTTPHDLTQCFVQVLKEASIRIYGEPRLDSLLEEVDYIRYSTTQGTNAVVQRKGPRLGLVLREGQNLNSLERSEDESELLKAMVGVRVEYVDPSAPEAILEARTIEVVNRLMSAGANRIVVSLGGKNLIADEQRFKRLALLRYPKHLLGAVPILYSHQLSDDRDDARRTWSSLLNAFLHPAMERFLYNAENVLRDARAKNPLLIFCNDGSSSRVAKTIALKTWGSGPRGGMEGAKALAKHYARDSVITMDIGGTTTDISFLQAGGIRERAHGTLENIQISFPLCEIESLGAGGSSIFRVVEGQLKVGPESVGGAPGPACFGYGGKEATITDAYLLLGILDAESYFGGTLKLDAQRAQVAILENVAKPLNISVDEALLRMEQAYVDRIATAIKGFGIDPTLTTLLAFGGAGPMTAGRIAEALGVKEIIVPRMAAVFSAFGIGFSDIAHRYSTEIQDVDAGKINKVLEDMTLRAERDMYAEGFDLSSCQVEKTFSQGEGDRQIATRLDAETKLSAMAGKDAQISLRATKAIPHFALAPVATVADQKARASSTRKVRMVERSSLPEATNLPLYRHEELTPGMTAAGPAVVEEEYFTCVVPAGWSFLMNENRDLVLTRK